MKKSLLALVTGTAIASGGYFIAQQDNNHAQLPQLDYVPADTLFFWSQLKSFPYLQYLELLPNSYKNSHQLEEIIASMQDEEVGANGRFLRNVLQQYANSMKSSESFKNIWGVNNDFKMLAYTVGLLPVLRAELGDPEAFKTTIKQAADEAKLRYEESQIDGASITKYFIEYEGERLFDLLVNSSGNWVTLTIDTPFNQPKDVKIALGLAKPLHALSDSGKIEEYLEDHQLDGHSLGYIDTKLIVDMLTATNPDSQATQMLDKLTSLAEQDGAFDSIRTPECQQDFSAITQKWPAIISGTQKIEITNQFADVHVSTIIASTDTKILGALQNIRGFLPQHTQSDSNAVMTLGFGLNASQLSPSVNTLWAAFSGAQFNCAPLTALQGETKGVNPAPLAMATGMLGSFKGVSATIFDIDASTFDQTQTVDATSLDALVTVSADDALALFNMAKSFAPNLASITLPSDGKAIKINDHLPPGVAVTNPLYLALKGQHLALYTGEMAEQTANKLSNQSVIANGLTRFGIDSGKILPLLLKAAEQSGEPIPDDIKDIFDQNGKMHMHTDINDKGIVFDFAINISQP
ncbi:hypothetical protein [Pseudoalteromonas luteoviolacea]|uniref:DUF3352 domain-containing protein n=1 Tax=Pseudoalteromonas luteoviolacea S4054 TaxID=1129367 RepID=A0A0F6A7V8_9GAMM|nr:hypothetical protein [Pseudoalteromonas luteoviolacea]AOT11065.1 hypothetical protein S4054249_24845 [Pseudoalteromonas luteoviolacea]AOT15771.1 hypothetical protein S40542_23665 [Pseudoalteromonas luteoviolacea]AOT20886.1 hypothetical protein S4054_24765 [Pseudoalteromonas luteoviolacea]KKE81926.1 hypothetical protein N479_20740 [Pseudoalteromonas luteoviolacea S4054]KZN71095.1 hypothetical protein N481_19645 [Pseudoalteromonas luteoviolacea S4047-1]